MTYKKRKNYFLLNKINISMLNINSLINIKSQIKIEINKDKNINQTLQNLMKLKNKK